MVDNNNSTSGNVKFNTNNNINIESSDWVCYLFGGKSGVSGAMIYRPPNKDNVPNVFVRWMMKVCLGCTWVKEK